MTILRRTKLHFALWLVSLAFSANSYAELKLNGIATHMSYDQAQFMAALFTENVSSEARQLLLDSGDKAMEVRIAAKQIYSRRFKRMWIESMAINSGTSELEQHAQDMADFSNMLKVNLRFGDILRIEKSAANGIRVTVDGHELGTIKNPDFFDVILRVWIGPVPLSTGFKNQLLAAGNIDSDLRRKFNAITPVPERTVAIGAALLSATSPTELAAEAEPDDGSSSDSAEATSADETPPPGLAEEKTAATDSTDSTDTANVATEDTTASPLAEAATKNTSGVTPQTQSTQTVATAKPVEPKANKKPSKQAKLVTEDDLFGDSSDSILDQGSESNITAERLLSEQLYISKVTRWTSSFVTYPKAAQRKNYEGSIRLTVTLNRGGEVVEVNILEKSKYSSLNRAAVRAVKKASPYPAIPEAITSKTFVFTVPVTYRLKQR